MYPVVIRQALLMAGLFVLRPACTTGTVSDDGAVADGANVDERGPGDVAPVDRKDLGQSNWVCPTTGAVLECGQPCTLVFKGMPVTLFMHACH